MMLATLLALFDAGTDKSLESISLIIGGLLAAVYYGKEIFFKKPDTQISPQPLIVAMEKEFTTKREFEHHLAINGQDHDKIFSKIGGVERGAAASLESKVETMRAQVSTVSTQVAGLKVQTELQNQQLARMDSKLDRLAERKNES